MNNSITIKTTGGFIRLILTVVIVQMVFRLQVLAESQEVFKLEKNEIKLAEKELRRRH